MLCHYIWYLCHGQRYYILWRAKRAARCSRASGASPLDIVSRKKAPEGRGCDDMSHRPIYSMFVSNLRGEDTRCSMLKISSRSTDQENKKVVNKCQLSRSKDSRGTASPSFSKSSRPLLPSYSSMTLCLGSLTK